MRRLWRISGKHINNQTIGQYKMGYFSELDILNKTINYGLRMRFEAVKKRAAEWAKHNPAGAYQSALNHQVKYKRKGWIKYDSANHYSAAGDQYLYNLDDFEAVPIQDISRRAFDYSGYYADNFQHELIEPQVIKIKTSRGLFIAPAIAYSQSDCANIYWSRGQFAPRDTNSREYDAAMMEAARIADSIAERESERGREDDAKFQAEQEAEGLKDDNEKARSEAHALILAIRDQRAIGEIVAPICAALISEIKALRYSIQRNNARIKALKNDFWASVN